MLLFCFVFKKAHNVRYGAYYVNQMQRLEESHLGTKEMEVFDWSIWRNNFSMKYTVDLAGEETFMKSAKTLVAQIFCCLL